MNSPLSAPARAIAADRLSWAVFAGCLLLEVFWVMSSSEGLPPTVASHFDAAGVPNGYMPRATYVRFVLLLGVGLPVALVTILTALYSRASQFKLPHRDYWLAPERMPRTRSYLIAHGVWFGSLIVVLICFMHWLELRANRLTPPRLSNGEFAAGMAGFLVATLIWISAFMRAFRRPP